LLASLVDPFASGMTSNFKYGHRGPLALGTWSFLLYPQGVVVICSDGLFASGRHGFSRWLSQGRGLKGGGWQSLCFLLIGPMVGG
jgi:hypothetical protein